MEGWSVGGLGLVGMMMLMLGCLKKKEARVGKAMPKTDRSPRRFEMIHVARRSKPREEVTKTLTETVKVPEPSAPPVLVARPKRMKSKQVVKKKEESTSEDSTMPSDDKTKPTVASNLTQLGSGMAAPVPLSAIDDESELSETDLKTHKPRNGPAPAAPPIPPPDEEEPSPKHKSKNGRRRKPLSFLTKGRVKAVPKDQRESWGVDKQRLKANPERRLHVFNTIKERGGYLINRTVAPSKEVDAAGERKVSYIYVKPSKEQKKIPPNVP